MGVAQHKRVWVGVDNQVLCKVERMKRAARGTRRSDWVILNGALRVAFRRDTIAESE
jgi:hypothetical protein